MGLGIKSRGTGLPECLPPLRNRKLQRSDLSAIEEVSALVDVIDTELLEGFGLEYADYGNESVARVRFVLMKLDSDARNDTDYFTNKFVRKVEAIFSGLPKPKEWLSFLKHDLPLLTSIDTDVQDVAADAKLNKSQTKALQKLKEADGRNRLAACQLAGITPLYRVLESDPTAYVLSANVHRRHLTKGQQAMSVALAYPDAEKGGRGKKSSKIEEFKIASGYISQARFVLRHCLEKAEEVLRNPHYPLTKAYEEVQGIVEQHR